MEQIPFLVAVPEATPANEVKGFLSHDESCLALREIPVERLRDNLRKVSQALMTVLTDIKSVGNFELSEVVVQVEITAEGGVQFIGSSKIGGKGAITLKFAKPE
jgi:hypothetical protein